MRNETAKLAAESFDLAPGLLRDLRDDSFPSLLSGWDSHAFQLDDGATHFGVVVAGSALLRCAAGEFRLGPGLYFSVPGPLAIAGGRGLVVSRCGYRGLFSLGGPVEERGRLKYIDGCSDSLLVAPAMLGDPCLNFLHMPPGVDQTTHTHPSIRAGVILSGTGVCETPHGPVPLVAGRVFLLYSDAAHSFHTAESPLRIVVYHPDSDFGPTHDNHPMVNRTFVGGTPATAIDAIRTQ